MVNVIDFLQDASSFLVKAVLSWLWAIVQFFLPTSIIGKDVKGQTVLITGAGGGIGSLLAERFARLGCNLVLCDINQGLNEKTANLSSGLGVKVNTLVVDLTKRDAIYTMAGKVEKEVGGIDILVNNAGVVSGCNTMEGDEAMMELTLRVNTMAHFWMAKAFLPPMLKRNQGHIVTITSSAGLFGVPGLADYCASKFGAVGFEESLRMELQRRPDNKIKTTCVMPYLVKTAMFTGCKAKYPFLMDGLQPDYTADKIVDAVLRNQEVLCLPRQIYVIQFLKGLMPTTVHRLLNDFAGVTEFMDSFVGRKND